jgi:hypothetical protein
MTWLYLGGQYITFTVRTDIEFDTLSSDQTHRNSPYSLCLSHTIWYPWLYGSRKDRSTSREDLPTGLPVAYSEGQSILVPEVADAYGITATHLRHCRHGNQQRLQMLGKNDAVRLNLTGLKVGIIYRKELKGKIQSYRISRYVRTASSTN